MAGYDGLKYAPRAETVFCGTPLGVRKSVTARAEESSRLDGNLDLSAGPIGSLHPASLCHRQRDNAHRTYKTMAAPFASGNSNADGSRCELLPLENEDEFERASRGEHRPVANVGAARAHPGSVDDDVVLGLGGS